MLEGQVSEEHNKNKLLTAKLDQAQDELDRSYKFIENTKSKEKSKDQKISLLESKLDEIQVNQYRNIDSSSRNVHIYRQELEKKTEECANLKYELSQRTGQLDAFSTSQGVNQDRLKELELELESKCSELERIQGRLQETEKAIDDLCLNKTSEGTVYLELEQLRADNKKLLMMLRKSGNRQFTDFVEDCGGYARYVPQKKTNKKRSSSARKQQQESFDAYEEWIPDEAFKAAHSIMHRKHGELTEGVINGLLTQLNKIWSERETRQITRLKKKYGDEIGKLKRQITMKAPGKQVELANQNTRLRQELNEANRQIQAQPKSQKLTEGLGKIEHGLKMYGKFQNEKNELLKENGDLRGRLEALQSKSETGEMERYKFLDGANWMSKKVASEAGALRDDFSGVLREFYDRQSGRESPVTSRKRQDWLIANSETLIAQFQHKLETIIQRVNLEYQTS